MRDCYPGSSSSFFHILLLLLIKEITSGLRNRLSGEKRSGGSVVGAAVGLGVASLQPLHLLGVGRVGGDLLSEQRLHVLGLFILLFAGVVDDLFDLYIDLLVLGLGVLG